MQMNVSEDDTVYMVIMDREEQYRIWPSDRPLPFGWEATSKQGTQQECIDYIEEVWTDRRPRSLREKMDEMERRNRGNT